MIIYCCDIEYINDDYNCETAYHLCKYDIPVFYIYVNLWKQFKNSMMWLVKDGLKKWLAEHESRTYFYETNFVFLCFELFVKFMVNLSLLTIWRCDVANSPCNSNPCVHGTCTPFGSVRYECSCFDGYNGVNCENNIGKLL
jgi:hypothetical protein